jgi:hypothetical protein
VLVEVVVVVVVVDEVVVVPVLEVAVVDDPPPGTGDGAVPEPVSSWNSWTVTLPPVEEVA